MKTLIIFFLATVSLAQTSLLNSNPSTTIIVSPPGFTIIDETYHNTANPDYLGTGASWIWLNGSTTWPSDFTATFQAIFFADCPQVEAFVEIAAEDAFQAYLNGNTIGSGDDWQNVSRFNITLKCGWNNLTVVVEKLDAVSPALIFAVQQNQTQCYECSQNPSAFYDRWKCQCRCSARCRCYSKLFDWSDYPNCSCKCKNPQVSCNQTQFWDQRRCSCECKPIWCPKGFKQDSQSCKCICFERCPYKYYWKQDECKCVLRRCKQERCWYGKVWHQDTCSCQCPILLIPCEYGQDQRTCRCKPRPRHGGDKGW